jgi:hypothetical protein
LLVATTLGNCPTSTMHHHRKGLDFDFKLISALDAVIACCFFILVYVLRCIQRRALSSAVAVSALPAEDYSICVRWTHRWTRRCSMRGARALRKHLREHFSRKFGSVAGVELHWACTPVVEALRRRDALHAQVEDDNAQVAAAEAAAERKRHLNFDFSFSHSGGNNEGGDCGRASAEKAAARVSSVDCTLTSELEDGLGHEEDRVPTFKEHVDGAHDGGWGKHAYDAKAEKRLEALFTMRDARIEKLLAAMERVEVLRAGWIRQIEMSGGESGDDNLGRRGDEVGCGADSMGGGGEFNTSAATAGSLDPHPVCAFVTFEQSQSARSAIVAARTAYRLADIPDHQPWAVGTRVVCAPPPGDIQWAHLCVDPASGLRLLPWLLRQWRRIRWALASWSLVLANGLLMLAIAAWLGRVVSSNGSGVIDRLHDHSRARVHDRALTKSHVYPVALACYSVFSHEFFIAPWLLRINQRFEPACHVYGTFSAQARALVIRATASYCLSVGVFLPLCFTPVPRWLWGIPESWRPSPDVDAPTTLPPGSYELSDCEFADFSTGWYVQGGVALLSAALAGVIAAPAYALLCEVDTRARRSGNSFLSLLCLPLTAIWRTCACCTCSCGWCKRQCGWCKRRWCGDRCGAGATGGADAADKGKLRTIRTQRQLDKLYEAPPFTTPTRYAHAVGTIIVTLTYSAGLPLLVPISLCAITVRYWMDKTMLLRRCRDRAQPSPSSAHPSNTGTHLHTDLAAASCAVELLLCAGGPAALHLLVAIFMLGHSEQDDNVQDDGAAPPGDSSGVAGVWSRSGVSDITGIGLVRHGDWLQSALAAVHPWWLQRYGQAPLRSNVVAFPFVAILLLLLATWVQWSSWWRCGSWCCCWWRDRPKAKRAVANILFDKETGWKAEEDEEDDEDDEKVRAPPPARAWSTLVAREIDKARGNTSHAYGHRSASADLEGSRLGRGRPIIERSEVLSTEEGSVRSASSSIASMSSALPSERTETCSSFGDGSNCDSGRFGMLQSQIDSPHHDPNPHPCRVAGYAMLQLGLSAPWRAQSSDPVLDLLFERPGCAEHYGESFASCPDRLGPRS